MRARPPLPTISSTPTPDPDDQSAQPQEITNAPVERHPWPDLPLRLAAPAPFPGLEAPAAQADSVPGGDADAVDHAGQPEASPAPVILSDITTDPDNPYAGEEPETQHHLTTIQNNLYGYLAGDAGTGKSYLARKFAELNDGGMLIATTGIAAVNIGGTTINSALRYFDTASMQLEYEFGRITAALGQLADSGVERLVVDEISMMDGRQLDILALALDDINERLATRNKPPLGVWLTGDFAQLPPVGANDKNRKPTDGPPPIYAFQAQAWSRWADNTTTLTKIRRQADPDFINAIQQVRKGDKACVDYFRPFISMKEDGNFPGTTILAKNDEVDRYNKVRMLQINAKEDTYRAVRTGEQRDQPSEWKNIPDTLSLKPGCLVMILANKKYLGSTEIMYANGDLGTYIERISDHAARVRLQRNGQEVVVGTISREKLKPGTPRNQRRKEEIPPEYILAGIEYMPLRVAYASTVHKSQGLSLDNIQVMINSQFWMSAGMLYVGLSRARTPQGIKIVGTVDQFAARVRANPVIKEWL